MPPHSIKDVIKMREGIRVQIKSDISSRVFVTYAYVLMVVTDHDHEHVTPTPTLRVIWDMRYDMWYARLVNEGGFGWQAFG